MILKSLLRRKARTLLTILGIGIGVAAIIGLGALANGLKAGYGAMLSGSRADLILSQPDAFDIAYSTVDEAIGPQLAAMPEVAEVSGMIQGFVQAEGEPFFFVFGHPEDSFVLGRFQISAGVGLDSRQAQKTRGAPILLGSAAAEVLDKSVGDTLRVTTTTFRVVGIYQTGDAFEDSGAVLRLSDAQALLGRARQVSLFYIQLKEPASRQRFIARVERQWPDLSLSGLDEFADKQSMIEMIGAFVWVIGGLAIVIGGVSMMNAQLMSVFERTREIGVLRAVGWSSRRVLGMILGEAVTVSLVGGLLGLAMGWVVVLALSGVTVLGGASTASISANLLLEAFGVVLALGLVGGLYPAWRAACLPPVEALRYEGGRTGRRVRRLPFGGMAAQSLWQRSTRTALTLAAIGITVGAMMTLEATVRGMEASFGDMAIGADAQVMVRQADVADSSLSALDERIGDKLAAIPEVESVSGMIFTAVTLPDGGFFILMGYAPNEFGLRAFRVVEGQTLSNNRQILLGRSMAETMNKRVGESVELSGVRFRVVGVYESRVGWEEMGGVITLRDAQTFVGRPRKVSLYALKLRQPDQAQAVAQRIQAQFPETYAALSGEFVEQLPDMQNTQAMLDGVSLLAVVIGGVGVLNTMLMAVMERTREIGVLRAVGWRRRAVLAMILLEAALLGILGGGCGVGVAFGLAGLMKLDAFLNAFVTPVWAWDVFVRAMGVAFLLGLLGGLYPAYRATRLEPVEALRYE
jgi:ABC-type antimicrobial peptide transport system permease subunit